MLVDGKVVEKRKSIRNYLDRQLSSGDLEKVRAYLDDANYMIGPFGTTVNLDLLLEAGSGEREQIGTYGFIKNAQGFIIGGSKNELKALFDFAYVLEGLVLYLTACGIGTCWLGGTFKRQQLLSSLSLVDDEVIPAIVAFGYPYGKPHLKERLQRTVIRPNKRKRPEELFFFDSFEQPLGGRAGDFAQALHYLRIAPSSKNKQSWRLVFSADLSQVHFYIASALADDEAFACEPEYLDIGIAYYHFKVGMDEAGKSGKLLIQEPGIKKPEGYHYIATFIDQARVG